MIDYNLEDNWDDIEDDPTIPDDFIGNENFYEFLKENNAFESYVENFKKYSNKKSLRIFFNGYNISQYIDYGFIWSKTDNPYLWEKLYKKWKNKLT